MCQATSALKTMAGRDFMPPGSTCLLFGAGPVTNGDDRRIEAKSDDDQNRPAAKLLKLSFSSASDSAFELMIRRRNSNCAASETANETCDQLKVGRCSQFPHDG